MGGVTAILKKELADHFTSYRFLFLFALIAMVSLITAYMAGVNISTQLVDVAKPRFVFLMLFTSSGIGFSFVQFVAFFGPLIGLILGFDTINRERNEGTLSKLLSQPIYRDSIINGKFLAGVAIIAILLTSILLTVAGIGLLMIGVIPGIEEVFRLFIYLIISITYISFWLGAAILFSIIFRNVSTSALAALAAWVFFSFFVSLGANAVANALTTDTTISSSEAQMTRAKIRKAVSLISPMELYSDSTITIVDPMRRTTKSMVQMGWMEQLSITRFSGPLPLGQSILVVFPYITTLIAITFICFGISYAVFMRQEIRSV